jgi:hypothetical protein
MASGPWRCSQCGTVNEPVANSCRTCGKWPSLFDLEDSVLDDAELEQVGEPEYEAVPVETFEPRTVEVETFEPRPRHAPPETFGGEPFEPVEPDDEQPGRGPRWVQALVPIAFLVYFLISFFLSDR